jgi:hypothetical protein
LFSFEQSKYQPQSKRCGELQFLNMSFLYIVLFDFVSTFQGVVESQKWHPSEKAQNWNTLSGQKTCQS